MHKPNDWYSSHPWYQRLLFSALAGAFSVPIAIVVIGFQYGGLWLEVESTRDAVLVAAGFMCAVALIGFTVTTFMLEVWWRRGRHPWWMFDSDDGDDAAMHEPDVRG
jgi:hypothetical protein